MPPTIITKESLYKRITELERKHCCNKNQFFDTFAEFPAEGATNVLYIDKSNGAIYIWDGAAYSEPTSLGEGAANRVAFWGDTNTLTSDADLYWDDTNNRLGVGTTTPAKLLDVDGDALVNGLTVGKGAGDIATNTVLGYQALNSNTTGSLNTSNGYQSLYSNTTAVYGTSVGYKALYYNTTGNYNTAVGTYALENNTTGFNNTAVGIQTLRSNTTAKENTAIGVNALYSTTTGIQNTSIGASSLFLNTIGYFNTATGFRALEKNTEGYQNVANGFQAGRNITGGGNNQTSNNSLYLGYDTRASANGNTNEIVLGYTAIGGGSNTATIGNSSITVLYLAGAVGWFQGNGTPEGAVTAPVGSFYSRKDGGANTTFYVKESGSGNTGWIAK
jgi:hypothetical protein